MEKEVSNSKKYLQSEANREIDEIQRKLNAECTEFCSTKDMEWAARLAAFQAFKLSYDGEETITINNDKENAEKDEFCSRKSAEATTSANAIASKVTSQISEALEAIISQHNAERKKKHDSNLDALNKNIQKFVEIFNATISGTEAAQTEEMINRTIESHLAGTSQDFGLDAESL